MVINFTGQVLVIVVCMYIETVSYTHLIDDMAETMYKTEGVGLAAPQVAVAKRIIVVDDQSGSGLIALINPEITLSLIHI